MDMGAEAVVLRGMENYGDSWLNWAPNVQFSVENPSASKDQNG